MGVQEMHAVELELENRALKSSLREYKARARTFRHGATSAGVPLQHTPRPLVHGPAVPGQTVSCSTLFMTLDDPCRNCEHVGICNDQWENVQDRMPCPSAVALCCLRWSLMSLAQLKAATT